MIAKIHTFLLIYFINAISAKNEGVERFFIDDNTYPLTGYNEAYLLKLGSFKVSTDKEPCPVIYSDYWNNVIRNCSSLSIAYNPQLFENLNLIYISDLILSNNQFTATLPVDTIHKYENLNLLDLSTNFINENNIDLPRLDCTCTSLRVLVLNTNRFTQFPMLNTSCFHFIQRIYLSNNKGITTIDDITRFTTTTSNGMLTYRQFDNLSYLDLSYCSLEYLNKNLKNETILRLMPKLKFLNLEGNKIKLIYETPFAFNPHLQYLNFDANQIFCDSKIVWLKKFILSRNITTLSTPSAPYKPVCLHELTNSYYSIVALDDTLFYSSIELTTPNGTEIVVNKNNDDPNDAKKTVTLQCSVNSRPESSIWWTVDDKRVLEYTSTANNFYELTETSTDPRSNFSKTSTLLLKNLNRNMSGKYSCKSFYKVNTSLLEMISAQNRFHTKDFAVTINEITGPKKLQPIELAGIIIGSIIGFLILLLLLMLCLYCCCYKKNYLCLKRFSRKTIEKKNEFSSKSALAGKATNFVTDDGFNNEKKPNYVVNTISKSMVNLNQCYDGKEKSNLAFDRSEGVRSSANFDNYKVIPLTRNDIGRHSKHYHLADRGDYVVEGRSLPAIDRQDAIRYSQRLQEPISYVIERKDVARQSRPTYQVDDAVDYVIERSEPARYSQRYQVEQMPIERRVNFDTRLMEQQQPDFDQRHYINNNQFIEFSDENNHMDLVPNSNYSNLNNGPNLMRLSEQYQYNTNNDNGFYVNEASDAFDNGYSYEIQDQYFVSANGPTKGQAGHMKYDSDV